MWPHLVKLLNKVGVEFANLDNEYRDPGQMVVADMLALGRLLASRFCCFHRN